MLSEINNAVCTALKDSSRGGVFLYGPAELWSKWVVGGVVRGYKASPAGRTVQTAAAWQASCTLYRLNSWKICVSVNTFSTCFHCNFSGQWNEFLSWTVPLTSSLFKTCLEIIAHHVFVIQTVISKSSEKLQPEFWVLFQAWSLL